MSTARSIVDLIVEKTAGAGTVHARAMFGEYGFYCDGKIVALICDDRLFLKPTDAGHALLPEAEMAPPYPGAKPHIVVPEDMWEEDALMAELVSATAAALPAPKPKRPAKAKKSK